MLRLHQHTTGTLVALDEYLYRRSSGMIGSLSQLVRGAAILAIEDGTEQITRELLDSPANYSTWSPSTSPPRKPPGQPRPASANARPPRPPPRRPDARSPADRGRARPPRNRRLRVHARRDHRRIGPVHPGLTR
jgi:hypothetical protein